MQQRNFKRVFVVLLIVGMSSLCYGQNFSFIHNSIMRNYIVHLPTNYDSANAYPLVINLHGLSTTAAIQQGYTGMDAVADTGDFILIYPDGISMSWNSGFSAPYNSGIDDVGFLSALIDTAISDYSIDTLRVYACGMSNGGFMSHRLACELHHRIAAVASVTGSMSDSMQYYCNTSRPVPVMQIHGTSDATVDYNGGPGYVAIDTTLSFWLQKNNCPSSPVTTAIPNINLFDQSTAEKFYYGLCDNASEVVLMKVTGGGHTWPGATPVPTLGNTNLDFNASGEIWKFFRKHILTPTLNPVSVLENTATESLDIWPNPSSDFVIISGEEIQQADISITSILGQSFTLPNATQQEKGRLELDISQLKSGIYLIKVTNSEKVLSRILVKQ